MDFARQQRDPKKHMIGLSVVILLHVAVIYGLLTGMAQRAVEVIKKPVTATIVEEIKPPPPPPPPPPPKKIEPPKVPPPIKLPYIPPPEIPKPPPPPVEAPVIQSAPEPPKEPYVMAPPPPPAPVIAPPAPPAPPPKPAIRRGISRVSGSDPVYPRQAIRAGIAQGRVVARLKIDEKGNVTEVDIIASSPPRVFDRAVRDALSGWKFAAEGEKYTGEVEINFTLKDE